MVGQQNLGLFIGVRIPVRESFVSPLCALGRGRRFVFAALLLAALPFAPLYAQSPVAPPAPVASGFRAAEHTEITLAPGVVWTQEITPANAPGGPLVVNVVRIKPDAAKDDRLHPALGSGSVWQNNRTQGRETVSGIAARNNALVAVNGSFSPIVAGIRLV